MPLYTIDHSCPLTEQQKDQLAEAITKIHTEKFTVPRFFVNVSIRDISSEQTYGGGIRVSPPRESL
jgi:phenylpyruvate tautomerase PptA (4-oxalocrotonate tautomerase family)